MVGASRRFLRVCAVLGVLLGCGTDSERGAPPSDSRAEPALPALADLDLTPGSSFELTDVAGNSTYRYRFALQPDEYLHLAVEQEGVDVAVAIVGADELRLLEVDSPTGTRGVEEAHLIGADRDDLVLELRTWEGAEADNRFRVRVEARRPATPRDRSRTAAARAYSDARRFRKEGLPEAAAERLQAAVRRWRESGDDDRLAWALFDLGTLWAADARHRSLSLEPLREALELYRRQEDRRQVARTLEELGDAYSGLNAWQQARRSYEASLVLWRELAEPKQEGHVLSDLGLVAKRQGQIRQALERYRQALELWRRLDLHRDQAITLNNLGALYSMLGEHRQAHDHYLRALALLDRRRDPAPAAVTLTKLGDALLALGSAEEALERYREALDLRHEIREWQGKAVTLNSVGLLYRHQGNPRLALEAFREALELSGDSGEPADRSMMLYNLGALYEGLDRVDPAREHFEESLGLASSVGYRRVEAEALFGLARLARRRDRLDEALARIEKALDMVESVRAETQGRQDLQSSFLATKQGFYDFLVELLAEMNRRQPEAGHDAAAFAASERARARGLLDALSEVRSQVIQGSADLRRLEELREQINVLHQDRSQRVVDAQLRTLLEELREAEAQVRRQRPRWAALNEPPLLSLEQVRTEVLDGETLLLEYHLTEERGFLWAIDSAGSAFFDLGDGQEIRESARRVHAAMTESHRATEAARSRLAAADLSRRVLAPAAALLGRRRLAIVANDALQYVPFAALPKPRAGGDADDGATPLVVDHEIVHLPSASILGVLRRQRSNPPVAAGEIAVLADPVFAADDERLPGEAASSRAVHDRPWPRLRHSRREADAILRRTAPGDALAAFDFEASRELVLSDRLNGYRILHFATHATVDAEHPELSAVMLSRYRRDGREVDGYLRAYEIFNLDLAADLVVLSACRTALGKEVRGEGLMGLTRAFMDAGASRVVVSLWSVNDRATAELMARFYRGLLRDRHSPAQALRKAQASMWRDERWRAPYYWAGFVVQGDWIDATSSDRF